MFSKIKKNIINTKLETSRLILRPITIKDLRKIFEMRNKNFVFNMMRTEEALNYKSHIKWFKDKKNRVDYAIINKKNKKIIGIINTIFYLKNNILYAELGKYIGYKSFHGKGLGSEATKEWVNFIFISTNINYFFAQTLKDNFSNIKLNKKLGFNILKNKKQNLEKLEWKTMKLTREKWKIKNLEILRNIYYSDLKKILSWRNSLKVREISLDAAYITYAKHLKWYKKIQSNKSYFSFLISLKNTIFGIVNLKKISPKKVKWSIYKKPGSQRGIGSYLAHKVLNKVFYDLQMEGVFASIYSTNDASIKFHESLGFKFNKKINNSISEFLLKKSSWMKNKDFINKKINTKYKIR
jgi:UDP-4-amino-4,6-dideoxy-N-acetyl-beta-L-altrosamine N-acetyltransferase